MTGPRPLGKTMGAEWAAPAFDPLRLSTHLIHGLPALTENVPLKVQTLETAQVQTADLIAELLGSYPPRLQDETVKMYTARVLKAAGQRWTSDLDVVIHTPKTFYTEYTYDKYSGETYDEPDDTSKVPVTTITNERCILIDLEMVADQLETWHPALLGSLIHHGNRACSMTWIYTPDMAYEQGTHGDEGELWWEILSATSQALQTRTAVRAMTREERRLARKERRRKRYTKAAMRERREALETTEIRSPKELRELLGKNLLSSISRPLSLEQLEQLALQPETTPIQRRQLLHALKLMQTLKGLSKDLDHESRMSPNYNDDTGTFYQFVIDTTSYNGNQRSPNNPYTSGYVSEMAQEEMQYAQDNCSNVHPTAVYRCPVPHLPELLTVHDRYTLLAEEFWMLLEDWSCIGITEGMRRAATSVKPLPSRKPFGAPYAVPAASAS